MRKYKALRAVVATMLVFILLLPNVVYAASNEQANEGIVWINGDEIRFNIKDTEFGQIVKAEDQYSINTFTLSEDANQIVIEEKNKLTGEEAVNIICLNEIELEQDYGVSGTHYNGSKYFDSQYYYYSTHDYWSIYNSSWHNKGAYENSSNSADLIGFKDAVDSLVIAEINAELSAGVDIIGMVVAILTAPTGIGAVIGALVLVGGSLSAASDIWDMYQAKDNADFYWDRV